MRTHVVLSLLPVLVSLAATPSTARTQARPAAARSTAAKIASAESAAPAGIASGATIVEPGAAGQMVTLRAGTNGWTCVPDDPGTPGPDPVCADPRWQEFMTAFAAHRAPAIEQVGIAYMLAGGADASNTDPFATKPAAGERWVMSPPHLMVLLPDAKLLDAYPGEPSTTTPFVMFKGTPYAHLMVPVAAPSSRR